MLRNIKNFAGTIILDFLAFFAMSSYWMLGLALAPVRRERRRDKRII